jgi:hypothetical protein
MEAGSSGGLGGVSRASLDADNRVMTVRSLAHHVAARSTLFLAVGVATFTCAWGLSTVPFKGVDEPSQYLRTLAIAHGEVVMAKSRNPMRAAHLEQPLEVRLPPAGYRTQALNTRVLTVDRSMAPPHAFDRCVAALTRRSCTEATYNGTYSPIGYVLPAIGVALAGDASTALWLGRLGAAIGSVAFLLMAVALSARGGRWSLLGLMAAISPTVLFVSSILNPDGLEIAASIAFSCGCLRAAAERDQIPAWALGSVAVSGAVTALTWALGPLFVGFGLLLLSGLLGRSGVRELLHTRGRHISMCAAALVSALALYVAWSLAMGRTHGGLELSPLLPSPAQAIREFSLVLDQALGAVGWINLYMPNTIYHPYVMTVVLSLLLAGWYADWRERVMLALVMIAALATPVLLQQWLLRPPSDQGVQGRYVIPVLVLVPLLSGHVLARHASSMSSMMSRYGAAIAVFLLSLTQVAALVDIARFEAGATTQNVGHAHWTPPFGWGGWWLLTVLGGGSLAIWGAGLLLSADPDGRPPQPEHRRTLTL